MSGDVDAAASDGESREITSAESSADDVSESATEAGETVSSSKNIPERLLLMFASTPEVERQIRQSFELTERSSVGPLAAPSPLIDNSADSAANSLAPSSTSETSPAELTQDEIRKTLAELSAPLTQFQLMLASTPQVLRAAASSLQPVQDLIELDKTKPATRKAIVEFSRSRRHRPTKSSPDSHSFS